MAHWLMKSEPEAFGWADLVRDGGTEWDGVRNNAARLHLKAMKAGDEAFFYHSMSDKAVVGIMRITREARARSQGWRLGFGAGRACSGNRARDACRNQGRTQPGENGADPSVAPVSRACPRRGVAEDPSNGRKMILAALALAAAQAGSTPREFIAYVYSQYRHQNFSPLERPEKFFSPTLTAAIRKDSSGGEVGYLDGDPLCDCQDYDRISAQVRKLVQQTPRSAVADVRVTSRPRRRATLS